jgi:hypothetical protein
MSRKNWIGMEVGRLTIMEYEPARSSGDRCSRYVCKCDCGGIVKVVTADLASGNTQSCGCLRKETILTTIASRERRRPKIDLTNRLYGKLLIVGLTPFSKTVLWQCKCDCGKQIDLTTQQLTRPDSPKRSCGCKKPHQGSTRKGNSPRKTKVNLVSLTSPVVIQTSFVTATGMSKEQIDHLTHEHDRIINSIELGIGIWIGIEIFQKWRDFGEFARWIEDNLLPVVVGTKLTRISRYNDFQPGNVKWGSN